MTITDLAERLTEAQREVVLLCDGVMPAYRLRHDHDGRRACWDIRKTGLFEKVPRRGSQHWHYALTATGQQVRAHLLAEPDHAPVKEVGK